MGKSINLTGILLALIFTVIAPISVYSTTLNTELVVNGGAEQGLTGWTVNGISASSSTSNSGSFSFSGPGRVVANMFQVIDISNLASSVDLGNITANFSVFLQRRAFDPAEVDLLFQDGSGVTLASAFFAGAQDNVFLQSTDTRIVPVGTRFIRVEFETRATPIGSSADGFMDDASLILTGSVANPIPEPSSMAFLVMAVGIFWRKLRK